MKFNEIIELKLTSPFQPQECIERVTNKIHTGYSYSGEKQVVGGLIIDSICKLIVLPVAKLKFSPKLLCEFTKNGGGTTINGVIAIGPYGARLFKILCFLLPGIAAIITLVNLITDLFTIGYKNTDSAGSLLALLMHFLFGSLFMLPIVYNQERVKSEPDFLISFLTKELNITETDINKSDIDTVTSPFYPKLVDEDKTYYQAFLGVFLYIGIIGSIVGLLLLLLKVFNYV